MPCRQDKAFIVQRGTEEPDALQVWAKSKLGRHGRVRRSLGEGGGHPSLKNDIDLEGCSPLQPWNHKGPTLGPCLVGKTKLSSFSAAPRDRTPSRSGRNQNWDGTDVSAEALAKAEAKIGRAHV